VVGLRPLFDVRSYTQDVFHQSFDVTADGQSFIFMRQRSSGIGGGQPAVVLVQNWLTDLDARLKR
jgi:hypothetical protein